MSAATWAGLRKPQQPGRGRLARPAPQPDLLDQPRAGAAGDRDGRRAGAVHQQRPDATARSPGSTPAPSGGALFGYDFQGCDTYARAVYGARASLLVGALSALFTGAIALLVGMLAGYFGGWVDAVLSRVIDIVLGIPLLLAAIVLLKRVSVDSATVRLTAVIFVLAVLGWTTAARVVRSSVISARQQDYVAAARMLGAGNGRIMWRHILPNALAPAIVVLTIALGTFIAAEATLSFLGIGLREPTISWGIDIDSGRVHMRESATPLVVPVDLPRADRAGVHHARRRHPRRLRPEAAVTP